MQQRDVAMLEMREEYEERLTAAQRQIVDVNIEIGELTEEIHVSFIAFYRFL